MNSNILTPEKFHFFIKEKLQILSQIYVRNTYTQTQMDYDTVPLNLEMLFLTPYTNNNWYILLNYNWKSVLPLNNLSHFTNHKHP